MTASYSKVLAFGSSSTWGWGGGSGGFSEANGDYEGDSYPRQLAALSGWNVLNYGIAGDRVTTVTAHDPHPCSVRFAAMLARNPDADAVVIWIGENDLSGGSTATQIVNGYKQLIAAASGAGAKAFIATLQGANFSATAAAEVARQQVNNWIRQNHGQDGCVEAEGALMGASRQVMASGYVANGKTANPQTGYPHLTPVGYAVVAQTMYLALLNPVCPIPPVTY
jgi:lysophospholipase L1-like esterase